MNAVTELLGCRYPVIQGAMGVICNPELVAAVSEAGGYGLLATAFSSNIDGFRMQVRATKKLTGKPFGANLFTMNPMVQEFADILAEEGVRAVTVSGGSPREIIPMLHERGVKVVVVVPTREAAKKSEALGADAVVAEGSESGGMQGYRGASTITLVPAVVDAVKIPVIAAGGIGDSRGFRAALALGALGVQVGTRFIATKECVAHDNFKKMIVAMDETGTGLVDMGRFRIRALRTPLAEKILQDPAGAYKNFSASSVEASWVQGDMDAGLLPAGEVTGIISNVLSVREVVEEMVGQ